MKDLADLEDLLLSRDIVSDHVVAGRHSRPSCEADHDVLGPVKVRLRVFRLRAQRLSDRRSFS